LLVACSIDTESFGSKPDPRPLYQTKILKVEVTPNPVAPSDSVQFTCIIEDSLDQSFGFTWYIDGMNTASTEDNIYSIKAPDEVGIYNAVVDADNGDPEKMPSNKEFNFEVSDN
jgi:hypothetical protein